MTNDAHQRFLPGAKARAMTAEFVRSKLRYDIETGHLYWVANIWRPDLVGARAGSLDHRGYRRIKLAQVFCRAPRLAWLLMTGEHPRGEIDHINGVRDDDRWCNLRDVDVAINRQNRRIPSGSIGVLGVSRPHGQMAGKFRAVIGVDGRQRYLGHFPTAEEAHAAYMDAKRRLHDGCAF